MLESYRELGFPSSWYATARSSEIKRGQVVRRRLIGRDIVMFRGGSGAVHAMDAYCPHLGAHLGHVGKVVGEQLRCGFHGFQFDPEGLCVATGYGSRPPPRARLATWPVHELHGLVFVWADAAGRAPFFELPDVSDEGWVAPCFERMTTRGHPQEVIENGVDVGHLTFVHGFDEVKTMVPMVMNAYMLHARYTGTRRLGPTSRASISVRFDTTLQAYGLGYGRLDAELGPLRLRHFVLPTPTDVDRVDIYVGSSVSAPLDARQGWLALAPLRKAVMTVLARIFLAIYRHDADADVPISAHKAYARTPALAHGDGPIMAYRRWVKRFYPELRVVERRAED